MKYDINLFEQLNEEYRSKPIRSFTWGTDSDSLFSRSRSMLARLSKLVSLEGMRVLEVGCGRGHVACVLACDYGCSVVGVDINERADDWNMLKRESVGLDFKVVDLSSNSPFEPASFDLIVSFVTWEHVIHPFTMLKECVELLKPSGQMYLDVNPYRSPTGSHRDKDAFFPFPHLLFGDEVFSEYYTKHTGKPGRPAHLNKLSYSHYREYFRILNLQIEHEHLRKIPLDREFYERFRDKLELYPVFDLELNAFAVLLRKRVRPSGPSTPAKRQANGAELLGELEAIRNSFSYRLGNTLVEAVVSAGRNTILLPYRLIRLGMEALKKRR